MPFVADIGALSYENSSATLLRSRTEYRWSNSATTLIDPERLLGFSEDRPLFIQDFEGVFTTVTIAGSATRKAMTVEENLDNYVDETIVPLIPKSAFRMKVKVTKVSKFVPSINED